MFSTQSTLNSSPAQPATDNLLAWYAAEFAAATSADARAAVCRQAKADGYSTSQIAAAIEAQRTDISVEIETITHHIALWYAAHPECSAELVAYKARLALLDKQAGEDDADAQFIHLYAAKDEYRALYMREWKGNR